MKAGSLEFGTVGATYGAKTHTLTIDQMPAHNHEVARTTGAGSTTTGTGIPAHNNVPSGNLTGRFDGGGAAHNNVQPSLALTPLIKT